MGMSLLDDLRLLLRFSQSTDDFDGEINGLIEAAKADLKEAGILHIDESDPLVKRTIILYVKANFGWDNSDAVRLNESYKKLKSQLSASVDYAYYKVIINVGEQKPVVFDGTRKESNNVGQVIFYIRAKNHIKYTVDGIDYYTDITGNCTITVGE